MKRSNRLVLLVGIFLAIVAFILIIVLLGGGGGPGGSTATPTPPTTATIVVAAKDIDLGATITEADVTTKDVPIDQRPADSFGDTSLVVGQIARAAIPQGAYISAAAFNPGGGIANIKIPAGLIGIAVQVDQISGVGTIIKPGDFVDVISGFTGPDNVPLVIPNPSPSPGLLEYVKVDDPLYNHATVKVLAQGLKVMGTLLPPPAAPTEGAPTPTPGAGGSTTLNGQQQIVILAARPQDAEIIKFTQMSGSITLVLRSSEDCVTSLGGEPQPSASASAEPTPTPAPTVAGEGLFCPAVATTGITLRQLVDLHGVIPPQVVQVLVPSPLPGTGPRRSPTP